ncbi:MAG: hypothetical protein JEZ07_08920 [Phycisphaerae bacterium]|nr:hypothetical protein [Phycisphaerae bacterium]
MKCEDQYEKVCKDEFRSLHHKLDKLDEAIRGNGRPGMQVRLDRLEQAKKQEERLTWLIKASVITAAITGISSLIWKVIGAING